METDMLPRQRKRDDTLFRKIGEWWETWVPGAPRAVSSPEHASNSELPLMERLRNLARIALRP